MPAGLERHSSSAGVPQLVHIDTEGIHDPSVNLAIEEYALRHLDPRYTYVLFYVNEPSIIIGRNQNTFAEINTAFVRERGLHVVRRRSGGGAVYHDAGNLNFSFITDYRPDRLNNFRFFTEPVVRVLREMGVDAELQGRNDVVVDGRKVSGNAQFSTPQRMFSHGTLLFDSDLDEVARALGGKQRTLQSRAQTSTRARVANIAEFAEQHLDVSTFRDRLLRSLFARGDIRTYRLSAQDWRGVKQLVEERYGRWAWNYGESPPFDLHRSRRFGFGELDVRVDVRKGHIEGAHIFSDKLDTTALSPLARHLAGTPYDREALLRTLGAVDLDHYVPGLARDSLVDLLLGADEDESDPGAA